MTERQPMSRLRIAPCVDSEKLAELNRRVLEIRYEIAESLGKSALAAIDNGEYLTDHAVVDWSAEIKAAEAAKVSIPPDATLPVAERRSHDGGRVATLVTVANQTTLVAAHALFENGHRPLALNFA